MISSLRRMADPVRARGVQQYFNLDLVAGDFITIMGPSGAGKSTLLGILGLYNHAWEGEYQLLDHAVHRLSPKDRATLNKRHVGFVFQAGAACA